MIKEPIQRRPFFLISNDDGIHAPGIKTLIAALADWAELLVIAPKVERSGYSQAITLMTPFEVEQLSENHYAVDGTPSDCVVFGLFHVLKTRRPDWVISGINRGANLGDDTLYSGTVGAAMEAAINGLPAMAVSLVTERGQEERHFATAAEVVKRMVQSEDFRQQARGRVLNVNVPNVPASAVRGIMVTELSRRHYDKNLTVEAHSDGAAFCAYGAGAIGHDGIIGNDAYAVDNGFAAVTVLQPSMFDRAGNERLRRTWPVDFASDFRLQSSSDDGFL